MELRKFKADKLFTGTQLFGKEKILIATQDGRIEGIFDEDEAGENIEYIEGMLCPGFVNCHCHLELSHLKDKFKKHQGLPGFAYDVITNRKAGDFNLEEGMEFAEAEMLKNGTVAVGDICNTSLSIGIKLKSRLYYKNFIEVTGWAPEFAEQRLQDALSIREEFSTAGLKSSIVPHAPYSVSSRLWETMLPLFKNEVISMHNQESTEEELLFRSGKGRFLDLYLSIGVSNSDFSPSGQSSLKTVFSYLTTASAIILVHNTFAKESDIRFLKEQQKNHNIWLCLCPKANLFIENRLPPVVNFMEEGLQMVVGTDSLASNGTLNILEEIKTLVANFPTLPLSSLLGAATINGANALGIGSRFGSFEKGKQPGILQISLNPALEIDHVSRVIRLV